jgi:hypothetical protein
VLELEEVEACGELLEVPELQAARKKAVELSSEIKRRIRLKCFTVVII